MKRFIIWLFGINSGDLCKTNYCDKEHHLTRKISQLEKELHDVRMHIITRFVMHKELSNENQ